MTQLFRLQGIVASWGLITSALLLLPLTLLAQSPGGVEGCEAWFVTSPSRTDHNGLHHWIDLSGDTVQLLPRGVREDGDEVLEPRDSVQTFNLHPALRFSRAAGFMDATLRQADIAQATMVGVFCPDTLPAVDKRLYAIAGRDTSAVTKDKVFHSGSAEALDYSPDLLHNQESATALKVVSWLRALTPSHSPWGSPRGSTLSMGGDALSGNPSFGGSIPSLGVVAGLEGWCPELAMYGRMLTPLERLRVESYLALKYGITPDGTCLVGDEMAWDGGDATLHRVAGVVKDSASCLFQHISTTSYEEAPRLSTLSANDSHYMRDSYGKVSANRLLAMGHWLTAGLPDKSYLLWGEDTLRADTTVVTSGRWHAMPRRWVVSTNIDTASVAAPELACTALGCTVDGGVLRLSSESTGSPRLRIGPKTKSDLHFSLVCPADGKPLEVGVASEAATGCRYGYRMASNGAIHRIVEFVAESTPIVGDATGCDIDIYKLGDDLFLQVNGRGSVVWNIKVPVQAMGVGRDGVQPDSLRDDPSNPGNPFDPQHPYQPGYSCYGVVTPSPGAVLQLRADGFHDTGSYAELSYGIAGKGVFKPYRLGRTYLLANGGGTRAYRCTGFDPERQKILFHDLALADADTLAFAWNDGLLTEVDAEEATCNGTTPQNDGKILIGVPNHTPKIHVIVRDNLNNVVTDSIYPESERRHTYSGYLPGTYHLTIRQDSTTHLHAWPAAGSESMVFSLENYSPLDFSWTYDGSPSPHVAGIGKASGTGVWNGIKVRNDTAWYVLNGVAKYPTEVTKGDVFRVWVSGGYVRTSINSVQHYKSWDTSISWVFRARFDKGEAHLWNLTGVNPDATLSSDRVMLECVRPDTLRYEVHIGSVCTGGDTYVVPLAGDEGMVFPSGRDSYDGQGRHNSLTATADPGNPLGFTAVLDADAASGPVQMLVFDTAGRLHREGRVLSSPPYRETFTTAAPGVYIVKALTPQGEHTCKVACGQP